MKKIQNINISHSSLAQEALLLLNVKTAGNLASEDIKFVRLDHQVRPFGIKHPMSPVACGYENYDEAVSDYLKLKIMLGFKTTDNLWDMVKATHEDEEGRLIIEGCYTNDPEEEYTHIATVAPDTTLEDRFGNPVQDINSLPESVRGVACDAIVRQQNRKDAIVQAVHDDIVKQVNEGDTTVLEGLLQTADFSTLLNSLAEDDWSKFRCKSSV